jgi:hypothetical protein
MGFETVSKYARLLGLGELAVTTSPKSILAPSRWLLRRTAA